MGKEVGDREDRQGNRERRSKGRFGDNRLSPHEPMHFETALSEINQQANNTFFWKLLETTLFTTLIPFHNIRWRSRKGR